MNKLDLPKTFDVVHDSGIKTLVVGGCSFTHNYSDSHRVAWPTILADKLNIDSVFDCAMGGAGNRHISQSVQWCLESQHLDPATTLVICMWSGHGREDATIDTKYLAPGPTFYYTPNVATVLLNGKDTKRGKKACAIQSFLHINSLYNYLQNQRYKFLFLDFMDRSLPNRSGDFELVDYLPPELHRRVEQMIPNDIENFYRWSLQRMLLQDDDFHPSYEAHETWCDQILVPYVIKNIL